MTPGHPWGHGSQSVKTVSRGTILDCGHKVGSDRTASMYQQGNGQLFDAAEWVCHWCSLERCPVCGPAGRNVALDGTEADERL